MRLNQQPLLPHQATTPRLKGALTGRLAAACARERATLCVRARRRESKEFKRVGSLARVGRLCGPANRPRQTTGRALGYPPFITGSESRTDSAVPVESLGRARCVFASVLSACAARPADLAAGLGPAMLIV